MFGMGLTLLPCPTSGRSSRTPERHPRRRTGTVPDHALAVAWLLCKLLSLPEELACRSGSRGMLSGRYGQQRYLLPGQRRCSPERGHDRSLYTAGSHRNACTRMAACRRIGGRRRGRHVFKYRTGGNSAHRTGSKPPNHYFQRTTPTDSTVATDDFHLVHCVHHRHYRSTQRSQHPCMQPDSGRSGDSAQRTRIWPWAMVSPLWPEASHPK